MSDNDSQSVAGRYRRMRPANTFIEGNFTRAENGSNTTPQFPTEIPEHLIPPEMISNHNRMLRNDGAMRLCKSSTPKTNRFNKLINAYNDDDIEKFRELISIGDGVNEVFNTHDLDLQLIDLRFWSYEHPFTLFNFILNQEYDNKSKKFFAELMLSNIDMELDCHKNLYNDIMSAHSDDLWIEELIKYGFNINTIGVQQTNKKCEPPVFTTILKGRISTLKILLENKVNLENCNSDNMPICNYLIEEHSPEHKEEDEDENCDNEYLSVSECLMLLQKNGASLTDRDLHGYQTIHSLAYSGYGLVNEDIYDIVLNSGVDINSKTLYGETALHIAARLKNDSAVMLLCRKGADLNIFNNRMLLPIVAAADKRSEVSFQYLLESGANLSFVTRKGNNVLHVMLHRKCEEKFYYEKILEKNPELPHLKNKENKTPIDILEKMEFDGKDYILSLFKK